MPCQNSAICEPVGESEYTCSCLPGFTGMYSAIAFPWFTKYYLYDTKSIKIVILLTKRLIGFEQLEYSVNFKENLQNRRQQMLHYYHTNNFL